MKQLNKRLLLVVAFLILVQRPVLGEEDNLINLTPYGQIDIKVQNQAVNILKGQDSPTRRSLINHIINSPSRYTPAVLYVISEQLYKMGRRGEAMYWYYSAQLRARFDVNRCLDDSAGATLRMLNKRYGADIQKYAKANVPTFRQMVAAAIRFENNTRHEYDHRWINLHGMRAARSVRAAQTGMTLYEELPLSQPIEEWERIHRQTIEDYKDEMEQLALEWGEDQG